MEVWELKLYFYPSAGGLKKKKKKKKSVRGIVLEYISLCPRGSRAPGGIALRLPESRMRHGYIGANQPMFDSIMVWA